jgi:hypothetical protein
MKNNKKKLYPKSRFKKRKRVVDSITKIILFYQTKLDVFFYVPAEVRQPVVLIKRRKRVSKELKKKYMIVSSHSKNILIKMKTFQ